MFTITYITQSPLNTYVKGYIHPYERDVSAYHVNTQGGSPLDFSNKTYTLITILADN